MLETASKLRKLTKDFKDTKLKMNINNHLKVYSEVVDFIKYVEQTELGRTFYCEEHGIYQIYSQEFIAELINILTILNPKNLLEIHAGDGLLSYYLSKYFPITATDDYSWKLLTQGKHFPVKKMDVFDSIKDYYPDVVLSCWAPQHFPLQDVLECSSVRYLVYIGEHKLYGATATPGLFDYPHLLIEVATKYALCRSDREFDTDNPVLHSGVYVFVHPKNEQQLRKIKY